MALPPAHAQHRIYDLLSRHHSPSLIKATMHCLQLSRKLSWRAMWRNHMLQVRPQPQSWLAHLPQIVKVERRQEQRPLRLRQTGMQRQKLQEQRPSLGQEARITSCHQVCQLHYYSLMTSPAASSLYMHMHIVVATAFTCMLCCLDSVADNFDS